MGPVEHSMIGDAAKKTVPDLRDHLIRPRGGLAGNPARIRRQGEIEGEVQRVAIEDWSMHTTFGHPTLAHCQLILPPPGTASTATTGTPFFSAMTKPWSWRVEYIHA